MKKSILITGCSSGIGLASAIELHGRGYQVIATVRKKEDIPALEALGLTVLQLDLQDSASIQKAWKETLKLTDNRLYALFNNGAYGQPGAVEDLTRETLKKQFETNFFGPHELTNLVLPVMRKQGYGRIIQNSSVLGLIALSFRGAYNATKYAVEGLSDTLRLELEGSGIYVSLIEPGPIDTKFRANALNAFSENIAHSSSFFHKKYALMLLRLNKKGPAVPFTLPAQAVVVKLLHALESKRPKARYYVTFPTYLLGYLKRILSTRMLDRLLQKI